jgi:ABC-type histidine transport system ATPase subunit
LTGDDDRHRPMIEVTDLVKNYGSVPAVRGVSLGVAKGEVVVLIGPSGCGKSTLLRCVHLLEEPTSGTIRVGAQEISFGGGGKPLAGRKLAAYRSRIGTVFQHFELFPHMTALQNVMEGPVTVKCVDRRAAAELARGLLAKVGLAGKEDSYPAQLSGGQAQRVAIARALAMAPEGNIVRRSHLGTRSRTGRRSARGHAAARRRRHYDDCRDARDRLRPRHRRPRLVHGRRNDRRARPGRRDIGAPG